MHRGPKHLHISEECMHGEVKRRLCSHKVVHWRVRVVACEDTPCQFAKVLSSR